MLNIIEEYHNNNLKKSAKKVTNNKYDIIIPQIHNDKISYQENHIDNILKNKQKILTNNLYDEYILLFESILEINNQFVGEYIYDVRAKLNHDKNFVDITEQFIEVTKKYCDIRISKPNNKDKNIIERSIRIINEIFATFITFIIVDNSINILFMESIIKFIPDYIISKLIIKNNYKDTKINKLYNFLNLSTDNNIDRLEQRLKNLSTKVINMKKYFIDMSFEDITIQSEYNMKWQWSFTNTNIIHFTINNITLHINHNGYIIDKITYMKYIYDDYNHKEHLCLSIFILNQIYNYLKNIYKQEDINKLENELLLKHIEDEKQNNIKDSIKNTYILKSYNITSNSTWNKFLKILKNHFGVVIEQGKGDDIKIYRKNNRDNNSKIYRTADITTKKREILIKTQENILKQLDIDINSWNNIT